MKELFSILILPLFMPSLVSADSWHPPKSQTVPSENSQFRFTTIPNYPFKHASSCVGRLEEKSTDNTYEIVWEHKLPNDVSPVDIMVSNYGEVITFDEWYRVGYGPNVVVIYDNSGSIMKRFTLDDLLTQSEIQELMHTISSIWWHGSNSRFDHTHEYLIIQTSRNLKHKEIRIRLSDGEIIAANTSNDSIQATPKVRDD